MEQNAYRKRKPFFISVLSLFSISVQSLFYSLLLYVLKWCTGFDIEIISLFHAFILSTLISALIPFTFLTELILVVLHGLVFRSVPPLIFMFMTKAINVLFLVCVIKMGDAAINGVELSQNAEIGYAYLIFLLLEWLISRGERMKKRTSQ